MAFVSLWLALGLVVLRQVGIEETLAVLSLDYPGLHEDPDQGPPALYLALCLTLLVVAWPVVLMELVRGDQQR